MWLVQLTVTTEKRIEGANESTLLKFLFSVATSDEVQLEFGLLTRPLKSLPWTGLYKQWRDLKELMKTAETLDFTD